MPFTSGTVPGFSGATGLMQTLVNYMAGSTYSDNLGTGNGVTLLFNKMLANTPVAKGNCRVRFKIAGVIYQVWDNGEGIFTHTKVSASSIDYNTGAISLTFTQAIDNGYVMGILYSTATNGEGRDWVIILNQNSKNSTGADAFPGDNPKEVVLKNSGPSYKEEILIGMREFKYVAGNHYGIQLNIYKQWRDVEEAATVPWNSNSADTGNAGYDATRNNWGTHPGCPLNDASMAYWFFVNKRRIIVIARVAGTIYEGFYLGGGIRFSSPSKYPHPMVAAGTVGESVSTFSSIAASHSFFIWPQQVPGCFLSILPNDTYDKGTNVTFLPKQDFASAGTLKKTTTGDIILYPVYLMQRLVSPFQLLMEMDGPAFTPFTTLQAENTLTEGADTYFIVQNIFRTTYQDYMGIKQV